MGWMDVEENKMSPKIIGETVNACITDLAEKRKDLWDTAETWAAVTFLFKTVVMKIKFGKQE